MSNQMIFKRYEVKYMLNRQQYTALRSLMKNYMTADPHGPGTIQSLYFDTPDYLLIRHSLEKPLYEKFCCNACAAPGCRMCCHHDG